MMLYISAIRLDQNHTKQLFPPRNLCLYSFLFYERLILQTYNNTRCCGFILSSVRQYFDYLCTKTSDGSPFPLWQIVIIVNFIEMTSSYRLAQGPTMSSSYECNARFSTESETKDSEKPIPFLR